MEKEKIALVQTRKDGAVNKLGRRDESPHGALALNFKRIGKIWGDTSGLGLVSRMG